MATAIFSSSFLFAATLLTSALASHRPPADSGWAEFVRSSCGATLYPALCFASLSRHPTAGQSPVQLARAAANVSVDQLRSASARAAALLRAAAPGGRDAAALRDCVDSLGSAADQTRISEGELGRVAAEAAAGPEAAWRLSNAQTWMSAALTNEETCTDGLEGAVSGAAKADVGRRVKRAKQYSSNALALVNHLVN